MRKGFLLILLSFAWIGGCDYFRGTEDLEEKYGKAAPVITVSFASKELKPGDTWKIYLQASDPDGDMDQIACTLTQPAKGEYFPGFVKIGEENGQELSGYLYLNTMSRDGLGWMNFLHVTLTVRVRDKAGHYSEAVHFPLAFQDRFPQEGPPPGLFREQDLGPIMVLLSPPDSG